MCCLSGIASFCFFFCLLKERSHTSAPGRDVSGALPVLMSWLAISGNTPGRSLSSVVCVTAVSPALITWPYTWRDTRARNPLMQIKSMFFLFFSKHGQRTGTYISANKQINNWIFPLTPQWRQCWPIVKRLNITVALFYFHMYVAISGGHL